MGSVALQVALFTVLEGSRHYTKRIGSQHVYFRGAQVAMKALCCVSGICTYLWNKESRSSDSRLTCKGRRLD